MDETIVKAGGKCYYVYSAVDVERNELILNEGLYSEKLFSYEILCKESTVEVSLNSL